jgi:hypothetical protein
MAQSMCVACRGTIFEVRAATPQLTNVRLFFVQCASCGGVVGATEYEHIGSMLSQQNEALRRIAAAVGAQVSLP